MKRLIILAVSLIILGLGTYGGCGGSSSAIIGQPQVTRTTFEGEQSEIGSITIPFFRNVLEGLIVNAGIDFNGDGMIASYDAGGVEQEEWVIQNSLLPIIDTEYTIEFDLVDPDIMQGDSVEVTITAGESEVVAPWDGTVPDDAMSFVGPVVIGTEDIENLVDPVEGAVGFGLITSTAEAQDRKKIGTPKDVIGTGPDKVGEIFLRRGLPDSRQQFNHCVGNSIANSLSWLARKCGFEDKFVFTNRDDETETFRLDLADNSDVDSLAAELIEIYKTIPGAELKRSDGLFGGISNDFILQGKEKITTMLGLPITNQFLSREKGEFKFDDIKKFMKDGCDVELILVMLDVETGSPSRLGHAVTLAGYVDKGAGNKSFIVHDPGTNDKFNELYKLAESQAGGLTFLYTFQKVRRRALVDKILVECCKDPLATEPPGMPPPPTPQPTPAATPMPTPQPTPAATPMPAPEPTPGPTPGPEPVKQEGFYQSVSGSCGIEGFTLDVSSEDNLLLMNFGENGGNVTFAKTDNPDVFQSIRTGGLIILGAPGHQCTITCGENNTISLVCISSGGSCSHTFQLVP